MSSYPNSPGYKVEGPSQEAAEDASGRAEMLRNLALSLIHEKEMTADEVATLLGETPLTIRPRITELHKQGKIEPTGKRRKNISGCTATVWRETVK